MLVKIVAKNFRNSSVIFFYEYLIGRSWKVSDDEIGNHHTAPASHSPQENTRNDAISLHVVLLLINIQECPLPHEFTLLFILQ